MELRFSSDHTVILGCCGRVGHAVAEILDASGCDLILVDINKDRLENLFANNRDSAPKKRVIYCIDVSTAEGRSQLFEGIARDGLKCSTFINCIYPKSTSWGCDIDELDDIELQTSLGSHLGSFIMLSKDIMKHFLDIGEGNLIHLASIQGIMAPKFDHYEGTSMTSPIEYSAMKAGIIIMVKWLAKKYKNKSIRVNCVSPGGILDSQPESFLNRYRNSCTNQGMLSAAQVAEVIVFIASMNSYPINGQNIIVDDGWSL